MTPEMLRDLATKSLDDLQGIDIVTMDVRSLTPITDYMIICTGRSSTQMKALADNVAYEAKKHHAATIRIEGNKDSDWILIDLDDVVVHVMLASAREFYSLEELWKPIQELRDKQST